MSRLNEIYEGWKNYLFQTPEIEALAKERIEVCVDCEHLNVLNICSKCVCPRAGKARSPESRCPLNKWPDGWGKEPQKQPIPTLLTEQRREIPRMIWDEETNDWMPEEVFAQKQQDKFNFLNLRL